MYITYPFDMGNKNKKKFYIGTTFVHFSKLQQAFMNKIWDTKGLCQWPPKA